MMGEEKKETPQIDLSRHLSMNVKIQLIDKKTGKVVKESEGRNALANYGALELITFFDTGVNRSAVTYLGIYDNAPSRIKYLTGSWGTRESGASFYRNIFTAVDSSNDSYTAYHFSLNNVIPPSDLNQNVVKYTPPSPYVKGSDNILRVFWTIQWSYT